MPQQNRDASNTAQASARTILLDFETGLPSAVVNLFTHTCTVGNSKTPPAVRPGQRDAMIESEGPRWPDGFLVVKTRGKIQLRV